MSSSITYEQPLNERIRSFLRIEYLFNQIDHYIDSPSEWDSRYTLSTLFDVVDALSRTDIKTELIKEMERLSVTLKALENTEGVDHQRLEMILREIDSSITSMRDSSYQPGQSLRQNEFITPIKQRNSIPGGSCNFDLPQYYFWLHKTPSERITHLQEWQSDLLLIKKSIRLSLDMIRSSANPSKECAENGFFQKPIEPDICCQLIRVILQAGSKYYPEISGGKHRFTVRFMEHISTKERSLQTRDSVQFELHCCTL